jgi:hypothetical protein
MTSRFPAPWRIVEIPNGFAVDDATGHQLGVFYGRADPNTAGHTGFLTIEEARQMAVDFARLPELLKRTSGRSQVGCESHASARTALAHAGPDAERKTHPETTRAPARQPDVAREALRRREPDAEKGRQGRWHRRGIATYGTRPSRGAQREKSWT